MEAIVDAIKVLSLVISLIGLAVVISICNIAFQIYKKG